MKDQLISPHVFAFVTQERVREESDDECSHETEDSETSAAELSAAGSELWELVEDLNSLPLPVKDVEENHWSSAEERDSEWSSTSHEFGKPEESEEEEEQSDVEKDKIHETFITKLGELGSMSKGVKRKVRRNVREISEAFQVQKRIPRPPPSPKPCRPRDF